jgi:RHS repeat-associated protein
MSNNPVSFVDPDGGWDHLTQGVPGCSDCEFEAGSGLTDIVWQAVPDYFFNSALDRPASAYMFSGTITTRTFDYEYDFWGRVTRKIYQKSVSSELFAHRYTYDANGDLVHYETQKGTDAPIRHAKYLYYKTGGVRRMELGNQVQGLDFTYTLTGQLKGINHPEFSSVDNDPGKDSKAATTNAGFAPDVFGLMLDYYTNDYVRTGSNISSGVSNGTGERYDHRIKSARWNTRTGTMQAPAGKEQMLRYTYDWKQQLTSTAFGEFTTSAGTFAVNANNNYAETMAYDQNGNITSLSRFGNSGGTLIDNLSYSYAPPSNTPTSNRLYQVTESSTYSNTAVADVQKAADGTNNYTYNANGDVYLDEERQLQFLYDPYGKLVAVKNYAGTFNIMTFEYDAGGNKTKKTTFNATGVELQTTIYVREASGAMFSVFERPNPSTAFTETEIMLDGGSVGAFYPGASTNKYIYAISDHLSNTRVTVSADKVSGAAVVISSADYYAWGMNMPGRETTSSPKFRLGYQGQEYEGAVKMYGFALRMYDQRLGRWHATDPYEQHWSPYLAMSNNPVSFVDPDGGWDEWYDRSGVSYYVDGVQVEGWEFRSFMNNPGHGDQISWSGMLFAGTIDYLSTYGKEIAYNVHKQDWGLWREFSASGGGNIATTPSKGKVVGEELVLDKGKTDVANVTVGLKWLSGGVSKQNSANLLNMGLRRFTPRNVPRNNGEIKPSVKNYWGKINTPSNDHFVNFGGQLFYSVCNSTYVFFRGFAPGEIQNLDGSYLIRGSSEHQETATQGALNLAGGELFGPLVSSLTAPAGSVMAGHSLRSLKNISGSLVDAAALARNQPYGPNTNIFRRLPRSAQDAQALTEAQLGMGRNLNMKLGDPRYQGWEKWHHSIGPKGNKSVVHYLRNPETGFLTDFKFK